MFLAKTSLFSAWVLREFQNGCNAACLQELELCAAELESAGATELPTWIEAAEGAQPLELDEGFDAADFDRGWQCYATFFTEDFFLRRVVQPACDKTQLALVFSHSGGSASAWLRAVATEAALTFDALSLRMAVRRRLRWHLPLSGGRCARSCLTFLDKYGDHAVPCHLAGRLTTRATLLEKTWARVLREAGARVRERVHLTAAVPGIEPDDGRHVEVVASGFFRPWFSGGGGRDFSFAGARKRRSSGRRGQACRGGFAESGIAQAENIS